MSENKFKNIKVISTHSLTRRLTAREEQYHKGYCISTHSLTRRLTGCPDADMQFLFYFNSQPHKEADLAREEQYHKGYCISTHSLTRRLTTMAARLWAKRRNFNSQPHKEADDNTKTKILKQTIFQLTASQGG